MLCCALRAQTPPAPILPLPDIDPAVAQFVASIPAFDNHAHTVLPPPADTTDRDFDALPVDNMEPDTDPVAWRTENPQLPAAWQALWHFTGTPPLAAADQQRLEAARAAVKQAKGPAYDTWLLDQAGIATQIANRVSFPSSLAPPRFRWVPYADALLFPLNNAALAAQTPDRAAFFPLEDKLRARYLQQVHLAAVPPTLDSYVQQVVLPILQQQRAAGAIAEKFEIAYLRPFGFADVPHDEAAAVYAANLTGTPPTADYTRLQDYLFRRIALECGRLGMVVHLHTLAGGGGYFDIAGADPLRLEPLFNDPSLRRTRFVLLHGGWPFAAQATALLQKPNVYLDLSQQSLLVSPRTLAAILRERLELYPDKVLFGTDGYPYSPAMGWEESTWLATRTARTALALALTGMLRDGVIGMPRAQTLARMVLHDNAAALYGEPQSSPR